MKVDRALQLDLLKRLKESYPQIIGVNQWLKEGADVNANLHYLHEHGLITGSISNGLDGLKPFIAAAITVKGLDFLEDDGGLSAILGVVTVKLHGDTIREILLTRVDASSIAPEEKTSIKQKIRDLPSKALGTLTEKLIEKGAEGLISEGPSLLNLLTQLM